jgi:predicted amidohydrolase
MIPRLEDPLKICALEVPASFGEPDARLAEIAAALAQGEPADLLLVPECALTGYVSPDGRFDLTRFSEPLEGPTLAAYRELARTHDTCIAGPLIEQHRGATFNSFVVVEPRGELLAHYRKRHPWFPETWATKGTLPYPTFTIAGLTLTLAICFDVHFLAREASETLATADVLLFPSAWVDDSDVDERTALLGWLVRWLGVTVVNANWGEGEPRLPGQGRSRIVGPVGGLEAPWSPGRISRVASEVARKSDLVPG